MCVCVSIAQLLVKHELSSMGCIYNPQRPLWAACAAQNVYMYMYFMGHLAVGDYACGCKCTMYMYMYMYVCVSDRGIGKGEGEGEEVE